MRASLTSAAFTWLRTCMARSSGTPEVRAELRVLHGLHGVNKVHWHCPPALQACACADADSAPGSKLGEAVKLGLGQGVAVLFGGDQVYAEAEKVLRLQDPQTQAALIAAKWPGCGVAV